MGAFTKRLTARRNQRTFTPPKRDRQQHVEPIKGQKDDTCNLTACQKPGAFFLHNGNEKYYCLDCVLDIGGFALRANPDPMDLFTTFDADMARYEANYAAGKSDYVRWQAHHTKKKYLEARALFHQRQEVHE